MTLRNEDGSKACICHDRRPVCDCEPEQPAHRTLSQDQLRFIRLHQRRLVERTQAIFQGAMVRATSDKGETATLPLGDLEALIGAGLVAPGWGGSFYLTERGRTV